MFKQIEKICTQVKTHHILHGQTDAQTDRQTDTRTDRWADRRTDRRGRTLGVMKRRENVKVESPPTDSITILPLLRPGSKNYD